MAKEAAQREEVPQARPEPPAPTAVHSSVQPVLARIPVVTTAETMTSLLQTAAEGRGGGVALGGEKPVGKVQLLRQIQRSFGNAYAQRVVQNYREPPEGEQSEGKGQGDAAGQEEEAGKAGAARVQLQSDMRVSSPSDPAEKEAETTAKQVVSMPAPDVAGASTGAPVRQGAEGMLRARRAAAEVSRQGAGAPRMTAQVASDIGSNRGSGQPLPASVRGFMEPRFRADFGQVRIHTGDKAATLNRQLSAQAFTQGQNIFFGRGKFQPETKEGKELIAHELTHTIQQGAAVQQQGPGVQRSEDVSVKQQSTPQVQRLGVSDALDYFADKANLIPGFRMFTIVLGINPINMSRVERSAANILRAVVEFIPGGGLITQALDKYGVFEKVGGWVEQQLQTLGMVGSSIRQAVDRFLDSLGWRDIFDLGGVWERAKRIFTEPVDRIINFVKGLASGILQFIKDAILKPLAKLAEGTRGYDLLKAVLGQDPISGEAVPRNADTLIGGFMKLIGQEEIWNNLKKANAVARAWAWFQGAMGALVGFVREIPGLFMQALRSLEIADIVLLPRAFGKVASVFGSFIGRFLSWAGDAVWNLLEIIFAVVAPGVMPYLKKAAGTLRTILRNPIGFIGNLVRAGMQGFRQFAGNFLTHLRASLIGWLTGAMSGAGIYIPQGFNLREIIKFVLSVLGLTWQNIRQKLVRVMGEPAVRALETGFDIVMTLVTQGPAAAWEKIQESLSNLREMVMEQIMTFVRDRVVQAAITRLLSMLNPAGAFIQAIIAIYNTVMFFVERLRQIAQVAASFIDSISAIASGAIGAAASRVEQTMAGLLTLVISFLARIAGLGRVSDAVTNVVNRVRAPIDRALDRVVDWIVAQARRLGRAIASRVRGQDVRSPEEKQRDLDRAVRELRPRLEPMLTRGTPRLALRARMMLWKRQYQLTDLALVGGRIRATINPQVDMFSAEEQQLGRELERILQVAETAFLAARRRRGDNSELLERARNAIRQGRQLPRALTQVDMVALIRELPTLRQGAFTVRAPGYRLTVSADGRLQVQGLGFYIYRNLPGHGAATQASVIGPGGFFQRGGNTWAWAGSVNNQVTNDPRVAGLRDQVEVARARGTLPANQISRMLVNLAGEAGTIRVVAEVNVPGAVGVVSEAEITYGRMAPMAGPSSAQAGTGAEAAARPGVGVARAEAIRQGSYAVIFNTLSQAVRENADALVKLPGRQGEALQAVAQAYDQWRAVAVINGQLQEDNPQITAAANALRVALVRLMGTMQGR